MSKTGAVQMGGGVLYVEMEEAEIPPRPKARKQEREPRSSLEDTPEDADLIGFRDDVEDAADTLRSMINSLATDVAGALDKAAPSEWTLEFNVGFKGKANPIPVILSGEGSAALKLKATWRRQ